MTPQTLNPGTGAGTYEPRTPSPEPRVTNAQPRITSGQSRITISSLFVSATILIVPLMQGGLIPQTLPVLSLLVGLAFLAEARKFLHHEQATWQTAVPWLYLWLGVSLYIFAQPAVRIMFDLGLTVNGIDVSRVYWPQHIEYWSFFTAYWLLAWVVSRQHDTSRALIVIAVITMALFQSLYGTIAFVNGQETILGIWPKIHSSNSVSGTFQNKNHFASFLAIAMPLSVAFLTSKRWTPQGKRLPQFKLLLAFLFLLITGAALFGTASRLGILAAVIGFLLWGWLYAKNQYANNPARYIWIGALIGLPILAGLWFGPQHLIERLLQINQATGRLGMWQAMLDAPGNVWLQGVGAGGFHDVFKLIHPADHGNSIWRAHSEYLQFGFEFGLIGTALLIPLAVYWLKKCRPTRLGGLERGALAGMIAILIHNIADFDMQVPGTAVLFWIAVGILFSSQNAPEHSRLISRGKNMDNSTLRL